MNQLKPFGRLQRASIELLRYLDLKEEDKVFIKEVWNQSLMTDDDLFLVYGYAMDEYDPFDDPYVRYSNIWNEFAYTDFNSDENLLAFLQLYGSFDDIGGIEPVSNILDHQDVFRKIVELYFYQDGPDFVIKQMLSDLYVSIDENISLASNAKITVIELINEQLIDINQGHVKQGKETYEVLGFHSLREVIYLQLKSIVTHNHSLSPCKNPDCNVFFLQEGKKLFHNKYCSSIYFSKYHNKKRRDEKQDG